MRIPENNPHCLHSSVVLLAETGLQVKGLRAAMRRSDERRQKPPPLTCIPLSAYTVWKGGRTSRPPEFIFFALFYTIFRTLHRIWDISEFSLFGEKLYLSPILDLCSKDLVSYTISDRPVLGMVTSMLEKAFATITDSTELILHVRSFFTKQYQPVQLFLFLDIGRAFGFPVDTLWKVGTQSLDRKRGGIEHDPDLRACTFSARIVFQLFSNICSHSLPETASKTALYCFL